MKTVLSKTGIEVLYPCSIHLLRNGEILKCEYKSSHTGRDLLDYVCDHQHLLEKDFWGLKYVDIFEQRHWLELDQLIRPQVRNVVPIHFHFRVKVYPPEPYRLTDKQTRFHLFMQLRFDLLSGSLCCGPNDSALLLALILQYIYGDFNPEVNFGNYIKENVLLNQTFATETKAMDIHKNHLSGLNKLQVEDLFLRMASQLEAYGIDPYLVEAPDKTRLNLWVNFKGMVSYIENKKIHQIQWLNINKVNQEDNKLVVYLPNDERVDFVCLTTAECTYIYRSVLDHLMYFTSAGHKSTVSLIGMDEIDIFEDADCRPEEEEIISAKESNETETVDDGLTNYYTVSEFEDTSDLTRKRGPKWMYSQICVIYIATLIFVTVIAAEFFSLFDYDISEILFLKESVIYFIRKYILQIN